VLAVGVWNNLKRWWKKWTGSSVYTGPTLTENEITDALGDKIGDAIEGKAQAVVRQIAIEAKNAGLKPEYWPYLYWLIASQPEHWPSLSQTFKNALLLARDVMVGTGNAPAYHAAVEIPPVEVEGQVDQAVNAVATWAVTTMNREILGVYRNALAYYEPAMQRATEGRLPANKALVYLMRLFEAQLERYPGRWANGDYIDQWMFGVLK
jgi:hypothetical protein